MKPTALKDVPSETAYGTDARKPTEMPPLRDGQIIGEKPTPIFEDGPDEDCTCVFGVKVIDAATREVECIVCGNRWIGNELDPGHD